MEDSMKRHLRVCSAAVFLVMALLLSLWLPGTTATADAEVTAPAAPKVVGSASTSIVTLKWNKVSGAAGYEIFKYSSDKKFHWFKTLGPNTTTLKLSGKNDLTYYYKVRSYKLSGSKKVYSSFSSIIKVKTAPSVYPVITSTSRDKKDSGIVRWRLSSYADGYEVFRSTSKNGTYKKIATIGSTSINAVRDKQLAANTSYYYKVRAYSKNSTSVAYGNFGGTKTMNKYTAPAKVSSSSTTASNNRRLVVVGDSRVLYMSQWCRSSRVSYIAKSGIGLSWLSSTAIQNQILSSLDSKTDLFIWIGTNDYDYYARYASLYSQMVPRYRAKGARVFLVGLGPFLNGADGYGGSNSDLVRFNTYLKNAAAALGSGVYYTDVYGYLGKTGFSFLPSDRVHYSQATTQTVFNYLLSVSSK